MFLYYQHLISMIRRNFWQSLKLKNSVGGVQSHLKFLEI